MGGSGYAMETGSAATNSTLVYNGYRRNSEVRFIKWIESNGKVGRYQSIKELHQATGLERHGLQVDYDSFAGTIPPKEGVTYSPSDYDLRLKNQANALDAGMSLPQVTDNFNGKAPDLGCYEHGQNLPHYGPRKLSN